MAVALHREQARSRRRPSHSFEGVRALAFDLDNTLVDFLSVKKRACEGAAAVLVADGFPLSRDAAQRELWTHAHAHGIDAKDVVETFVTASLEGDRRLDLARRGREAYDAAEERASRPYPGVHDTLRALAAGGFRLLVITDAPRRRATLRLRGAGLEPYFERIIAREETPEGKADVRPYALALAHLGLAPHRLLMVGDNPSRDVGPAKRLGCRTALAAYGLQPDFASDAPEHRADVELPSFSALLSTLRVAAAPLIGGPAGVNKRTPAGVSFPRTVPSRSPCATVPPPSD